ncbi:MAG: hypothetical protein K0S08_518 [Gammaproteobacteria bacterium]|jgi:hypothetical protein|nr:hypothetical protein [Gammaproteobacteria bacterium]
MFHKSRAPDSPGSPHYAQETKSSLQRKREKRKARRSHIAQDSQESLPLLSSASQESPILAVPEAVSSPFFMKPRRMYAISPDVSRTASPSGAKKELSSAKTPPARATPLLSPEDQQAAISLLKAEAVDDIKYFLGNFIGIRPESPVFGREEYEQDMQLWGELERLRQELLLSLDVLQTKLNSSTRLDLIQELANKCECLFVAIRHGVRTVPEKTQALEDWLREERTGVLFSMLTIKIDNIITLRQPRLSFS